MSPAVRPSGLGEAGFSLTELMVSSLVMILVTTALFSSLEQTEVLYEDYTADIDLRQQARVATTQIGDELRMMGYDLGNLDEALTIASDTQIQFVGDLDDADPAGACDASAENATNGGAERVTYTYDGEAGTLQRQVDCWNGNAWTLAVHDSVMLEGLPAGGFLFRYYDITGTQVPLGGGVLDADTRDDVRSVALSFDLKDADAERLLGENRTDTSMAYHVKLQNRWEDD